MGKLITIKWYGCLYCHTNLINGKKYWGVTIRKPEVRWGNNGYGYKRKDKDGNYSFLYNSILKYGWDNFQHDIVGYFTTKQELNDAEIYWIKATRSNESEFGYNLTNGGSSGRQAEESINKTRVALTGRKLSDSHCSSIRRSKIGLKQSSETIIKRTSKIMGKNHPKFSGGFIATNVENGDEIVLEGYKAIIDAGFNYSYIYRLVKNGKIHRGFTFRRKMD